MYKKPEKLYKVLNVDGSCCNGGTGQWFLPTYNPDGSWTPGEWMQAIEGYLEPCSNGYHVCTIEQLITWLGPAIFEVEIGDEYIDDDDKLVARKARLLSNTAWNEQAMRLFTCDCVEHVLHLFEDVFPGDNRPRTSIETTRSFVNGEATKEDLVAAEDAAWAAAWVASAAWDAARVAARIAAWVAAGAAAGDAARIASAARDAARIAAGDARDAEREWQVKRLSGYLEGNNES